MQHDGGQQKNRVLTQFAAAQLPRRSLIERAEGIVERRRLPNPAAMATSAIESCVS